MIDSHAHLSFDAFDGDRSETIDRARESGVRAILDIGTDVATSEAAVRLARSHADIFAAAGIHPTSKVGDLDEAMEKLSGLIASSGGRVVAVGEVGLDYYWKDVAPQEQEVRLRRQIALARTHRLPLILHSRDAMPDLLSILGAQDDLPGGVFHCFSGNLEDARRVLGLGFHVSFAGNVTYPKARALQEVARSIPLENLLLETDCPFLAPQPCRGKRNEPSYLRHTRDFLAGLRGISVEHLEQVTEESTVRLFGLPEMGMPLRGA